MPYLMWLPQPAVPPNHLLRLRPYQATRAVATHIKNHRTNLSFQFIRIGSSRRPVICNVSSDWTLDIFNGHEQVILICTAIGENITGGYWERVDGNHGLSPIHNESEPLSNNHRKATLQMTIARAHPTHSGRYRCVIVNQWGVGKSRDVQVTIRSKDKYNS